MTPAEIELIDALQELYDFGAVQYGQNRDESLAAFAKAGEVLRKYREQGDGAEDIRSRNETPTSDGSGEV